MSLADTNFLVREWSEAKKEIIRLRKRVFMDEFGLPLNFLRHRDDELRYHVMVYDDLTGMLVATGSLHNDGHLGRIAILSQWRTPKVGQAVVSYLCQVARILGMEKVWLNAPTDTLPFYHEKPFAAKGDVFSFCGVPLQKLEYRLPNVAH